MARSTRSTMVCAWITAPASTAPPVMAARLVVTALCESRMESVATVSPTQAAPSRVSCASINRIRASSSSRLSAGIGSSLATPAKTVGLAVPVVVVVVGEVPAPFRWTRRPPLDERARLPAGGPRPSTTCPATDRASDSSATSEPGAPALRCWTTWASSCASSPAESARPGS